MKFYFSILFLFSVFFSCDAVLKRNGVYLTQDNYHLLLITGCGRSGTTYISRLLQECGLDIPHEYLGKHGSSSWYMAPDLSKQFQHVFHQVRNPIDVISSWYFHISENHPVWEYIYHHLPMIQKDEPALAKWAKYWVYWNMIAERRAEWRYRIEDIDKIFPMMSQILGIPLDKTALQRVPKDTNHWGPIPKKVTWVELSQVLKPVDFMNLKYLAQKYGYPDHD